MILLESHPAWGEWIEMLLLVVPLVLSVGLTPHGVSGLKFVSAP